MTESQIVGGGEGGGGGDGGGRGGGGGRGSEQTLISPRLW